MTDVSVMVGDCIENLRAMPEDSVQCCVTSPPYFGLRDYGHAGHIGLEPTPDAFVARLVDVFREVRRVLAPDGTLWVNLGDSYAGAGGATQRGAPMSEASTLVRNGGGGPNPKAAALIASQRRDDAPVPRSAMRVEGCKPKDLMGVPWLVAFALRADGWYLRQDIIWSKPNPMPESVEDRCTKAHEYLFLLSKSPRYFYDATAIRERAVGAPGGNVKPTKGAGDPLMRTRNGLHEAQQRAREAGGFEFRNRRSVWTITSEPYPGAHFATFPTELPRLCILAGTRPGDTVLDPFAGSGTTLAVAQSLGRRAVGIELNPDYAALIRERLRSTPLGLALEFAPCPAP